MDYQIISMLGHRLSELSSIFRPVGDAFDVFPVKLDVIQNGRCHYIVLMYVLAVVFFKQMCEVWGRNV